MPPKKQQKESKKTQNQNKARTMEDKTFGLKNKKGAKQQKFVQQIKHQVATSGDPERRKLEAARALEKSKKEEERKRKAEIDSLFKEVIKIPKGVDPKSMLCPYFKAGKCAKGDKCKFSHDLAIERKSAKRGIYEEEEDKENDTMDGWNEEKLAEVVQQKHGKEKKKNKTAIVCKHFVKALNKEKYGWFWSCPSGEACIYKHVLPPGFKLNKDKKNADDNEVKISIEELVETERKALGFNTTPVTLQTFTAWKMKKRSEKEKAAKQAKNKKKNDFKQGKLAGITGIIMFELSDNSSKDQYQDDAEVEAGEDVDYTRRSEDGEDDGCEVKGVSLDMFVPLEVDSSLALKTELHHKRKDAEAAAEAAADAAAGEGETSGTSKQATSPPAESGENPAAASSADAPVKAPCEEIPIDESLFADDLDLDMEGLDLDE